MRIKDLVKNKRLELNETQSEFGKRFGISHAAISDLESGKTKHISEELLNFIFVGNDSQSVRNLSFNKEYGLIIELEDNKNIIYLQNLIILVGRNYQL